MKRVYILLSCLLLTLVACDDFLSKEPSKSSAQKVESLDDLDAILNYPFGDHSSNGAIDFFCTDNTGFSPDMYKAYKNNFTRSVIQQYLWETQIDEQEDAQWNACYSSIWNANLVISFADKLEGDADRKANLKAEGHALRAYKYFTLALNYCLHYTDARAGEMGLPLRKGLDFEESIARASLAETWNFIDEDIREALKITVPFEGRRWRASVASVNAFAARYYLYRGYYEKAEHCADIALQQNNELADYNTIGHFLYQSYQIKDVSQPYDLDVYYPETYNYNDKEKMNWPEQYQTEKLQEPGWKIIPSRQLLDLYDPNDLRFKLFMVDGYMNRFVVSASAGYGYQFLYGSEIYTGPSVAEMLLIKAECLARKNDVAGCMKEIETLRRARFAAADYEALPVPADKMEAVRLVLDERRREAPFALRWMDLRRLTSDDLLEPVTVKRTFYPFAGGEVDTDADPVTYELTPDSRRYARPIGLNAILQSNGQTQQNRY